MIPIITVGFDKTVNGDAAVRWACAEADRRGARLRVIHSQHLPVIADLPSELDPGRRRRPPFGENDVELVAVREEIHDQHPMMPVDIESVEGPAWYWLTQPLEPLAADNIMVVVGPSSHVSETGLSLGGTTRHVVHHAICPVVVVGGDDPTARRVVVGIDGSPHSDAALSWAIQEANLHLAPLKVVHIWQYAYTRVRETGSLARDLTLVDAACLLDAAVERARQGCFGSVDAELLEGDAAYFLPTVVRHDDLLVLGRSRRGPLRRTLFGSTVTSVLDNVAVTVALIPAAGEPSPARERLGRQGA